MVTVTDRNLRSVMGRVFLVELESAGGGCYRCKLCNTPLALADHLLSDVILSSFLSLFVSLSFLVLIIIIIS